jgi:hypothetical protein
MSGIIHKIALLGREFTVQTEFIAGPEPKIRTLVYDGGRLVTTREISVDPASDTDELIKNQVHIQHRRITRTLVTRAAELQSAKRPAAAARAPLAPAPPKPEKRKTPRPAIEPGSRLEIAVAIRRTIGPFSLAFGRPAPATATEYEQLLAAVESAIDEIMKAPIYEQVRLDEQLTFIALRGQLATWRLSNKDLSIAAEIWPSVERFAYHLQKINARSDLVAFDHKLLTWAMSELGRGLISEELLDGLAGLAGRDAELDHFLAHPDEASPHDVLGILLGLLDRTLA